MCIKYAIIASAFFVLLFAMCDSKKDIYYTQKTSWTRYERRIPLLKPYDVQYNQKIWYMEFYRPCKTCPDGWTFSICATKINVMDSIIIVYCNQKYSIKGNPTDSLWSFIIPSRNIEVTFSDKKSFQDSLSYYTKKPPIFKDIEDVWRQYDENGWLDWFPEAYCSRQ
jgi:hypothetical protein